MGRSESSRSLGFSICLRGRPTIKASSPVQSKSSSAFSVIFLHSTVNSSRAVEICRWITAKLQSAIDTMTQAAERARRARLDLLDRMEHEGWDLERLRSEAQHSRYLALALGLCFGGRTVLIHIPDRTHRALRVRFGNRLLVFVLHRARRDGRTHLSN